MSTFGTSSKRESVMNRLLLLKEKEEFGKNSFQILYKLHNEVSGCVLVCKNKSVQSHAYDNVFLALVYGNIKNKNGKIKMYLSYKPNSSIMIPSDSCENLNQLKNLTYQVVTNISYQKYNFTLLKIYIVAEHCKYIKPLLFYCLSTCIVGDKEYFHLHKKLNEHVSFEQLNNIAQHSSDLPKTRSFLLKNLKTALDKNLNKNREIQLHLHCLNVRFHSLCNKIISVSCNLPNYFKETLQFLQMHTLIKQINQEVLNTENRKELIQSKHWEPNTISVHSVNQNIMEPIDCNHTFGFYDKTQDEEHQEQEHEELLNQLYHTQNNKKKKVIKRGVLAKDVNKLNKSDAPIFFTQE